MEEINDHAKSLKRTVFFFLEGCAGGEAEQGCWSGKRASASKLLFKEDLKVPSESHLCTSLLLVHIHYRKIFNDKDLQDRSYY